MLRRHIVPVLTLLALAGQANAAPAENAALEPTSKWNVNYGDEQCSLLRQFGAPKDGVLLEIASFGQTNNFRVMLAGKPLSQLAAGSRKMPIRLTPDTDDRNLDILTGKVADGTPAVLFSTKFSHIDAERERLLKGPPTAKQMALEAMPRGPELAFEEQVTTLQAKFGKRQVTLHTGKMDKPLAALRTCVASLETSWGLDPVAQGELSREAVPLPSTVKALQYNYPTSMVLNGLSTYVPVRVMVDAEGNVGACVVQSPGVEAAFKKAVCDGFATHFQPALDAQGKPIATAFITSVIFRLS